VKGPTPRSVRWPWSKVQQGTAQSLNDLEQALFWRNIYTEILAMEEAVL
jgi:hypothetical protein